MASIMPPASPVSMKPFRFLDLSPEVRNKIYELVLYFPRPIYLSSATDLYKKHNSDHTKKCPFQEHQMLPHPAPGNEDCSIATWCINPFTNTKRKLSMPRSVLTLRHVCKQIDREMRYMFFAINEFYFLDSEHAYKVFESMANRKLVGAITVMGFAFSSMSATRIYPALATACPNVRVLKVLMDYRDKKHVFLRGYQTLRKASGVRTFCQYVAGLEKLERLDLVGRDFVDDPEVDGETRLVEIDINHPQAVGVLFRKSMDEGRRKRVAGEEPAKRPKKRAKSTMKAAPQKR